LNWQDLKDKMLREWNEAKIKPFILATVSYMLFWIMAWFEFVFKPSVDSWTKYNDLENNDPIIVIAVGGFIMLSLWFVVRVLEPASTFYTLKLYGKIKRWRDRV